MTAENETTSSPSGEETPSNGEGRDKGDGSGEDENKRPDDTLAKEKKCPECGAPVDDVRATCIDCGYEYKDEDHEDDDAGSDFVAGTQVDDEGNEIPEDPDEDDGPDQAKPGDDETKADQGDDASK